MELAGGFLTHESGSRNAAYAFRSTYIVRTVHCNCEKAHDVSCPGTVSERKKAGAGGRGRRERRNGGSWLGTHETK